MVLGSVTEAFVPKRINYGPFTVLMPLVGGDSPGYAVMKRVIF